MDIDKLEDQLAYALADAESISEILQSIDFSSISIENSQLLYAIKVAAEHGMEIIKEVIDDLIKCRMMEKVKD